MKNETKLISLVAQDLGIQGTLNIRSTKGCGVNKDAPCTYYFLTYRGAVLGVVYILPNRLLFKPANKNGRAKYREVTSCQG
jgi:hypothetical protein